MTLRKKTFYIITLSLFVLGCNNKLPETMEIDEAEVSPKTGKTKDSIEGIYTTQADASETGECKVSIEIIKTKDGYSYIFKTKSKNLKGIAELKEESGEKNLILKGIKWDYYEGDISNEEEGDSIADKEIEIPVDIGAIYVTDTLTIQNYGNAMNSYTKIEECGRKYIQLIRK